MKYHLAQIMDLKKQLIKVFLIMAAGMAVYQLLKYFINPDITLFQSNVLTVLFTSLAATVAAWFVLRRQAGLYKQTLDEIIRRRKAEEDLETIRQSLEERVRDQMRELSRSNENLLKEIEERRRAEAELRESQEKYRALAEDAAISITSFDRDGVVTFINKYHLRTFARNRVGREYFLGRKITELPGIVNSGISDGISQVLQGKTIELNDIYCPEFSGGYSGYMNLRAVPLMKDGIVAGGILIREEVTARKQVEEELRRANKALATISACHKAILLASDEAGMLQDICQAIVDAGTYPLAWVGLIEPDDNNSFRIAAHAGFENGFLKKLKLVWSDTENGQHPFGQCIRSRQPVVCLDILNNPLSVSWRQEAVERGYASTIALPLMVNQEIFGALRIYDRDPHAFDEATILLLSELTEEIAFGLLNRRLQIEQEKARQEKRRLETQLRQAQKMEAIGTLAGGIAHDFNNILGAMLGYTQLALMEAPPEAKFTGYLHQIQQAGNRATELVRQILAFSRQSEGERRPVEIGPIIKEALKLLRASLPSTIKINSEIDPGAGVVLADPTQIHQLLMNLCTNAAQAMSDSGGLLSIGLSEVRVEDEHHLFETGLSTGSYLKLQVADTGCGIAPQIKDRVFEPYFTTKPPGEGTGMGLAIVHGIVQNHGGSIKFYSEPGQGTTFSVYLPRITEEPEIEMEKFFPLEQGSERILFVDDEAALVEIGQTLLQRLGYRVEARTNSLEALDIFRRRPFDFDLIITDQTMPHLTGLELARRIIDIRPDVPVLLCSGFSYQITQEKMASSGVRGLVMKPVLAHELSRAIRQALGKTG
ncbi:MAG: ATP-binding protein [Thermodesulfobacteriota bacterium]